MRAVHTFYEKFSDLSDKFNNQKNLLLAQYPGFFKEIHHIGSTSVALPQINPVIDILAVSSCYKKIYDFAPISYDELEFKIIPGHRLFTHNEYRLYCYIDGHPEIERYFLYRDWLNNNDTDRLAYTSLRQQVFNQSIDYSQYLSIKSFFIRNLEKKAGFHGLTVRHITQEAEFTKANFFRIPLGIPPLSRVHSDRAEYHHLALYDFEKLIGYAFVQTHDHRALKIHLLHLDKNCSKTHNSDFEKILRAYFGEKSM